MSACPLEAESRVPLSLRATRAAPLLLRRALPRNRTLCLYLSYINGVFNIICILKVWIQLSILIGIF